jgi:hypothetical protein
MNLREIILGWAIATLPWCSLLCQATNATPQDSPPKPYSSPTLTLSFGPTESNAEGRAAANKLLQALGGPAKVNAVKSTRQMIVATRQGQRMDIDQTVVYPNKQAQKMRIEGGKTMLLVATPSDAFTVVGTQTQTLSPTQRSVLDNALRHDVLLVLQHINDPKYIFAAAGHELVAGVDATVVDVEADGIPTRWWIGPDGKLLQERYTGEGEAVETMTYSDWKNYAGLQYPTKYEMFDQTGQWQLSMTLTSMVVNQPVNPKLFERP